MKTKRKKKKELRLAQGPCERKTAPEATINFNQPHPQENTHTDRYIVSKIRLN